MVRIYSKPKTPEEALRRAENSAKKRELLRVAAAKRASAAIASAINQSDSITAIRVQQPKSLSLDERIKMILLQVNSERYKGIDSVAESIAAEAAESFAAEVEKDDAALIYIMFAPKSLYPNREFLSYFMLQLSPLIENELWFVKVLVFDHSLSSDKIMSATDYVSRITAVDFHWRWQFTSPIPEDQRIDMMLFELARFEMNVMVAELNVLLPIQNNTAMIAVNVMVARLNEFVTTVTSNPQSNATVILRLATAAFRRVVLVTVNEMPFSKETLLIELSQSEDSTKLFDSSMVHGWYCSTN